jgi:U4/U6.U5 tri-snRNP-associated protein 1
LKEFAEKMKEVKFLEEETLGKGLSEVLKILRERGALSTEDLIRSGRSND